MDAPEASAAPLGRSRAGSRCRLSLFLHDDAVLVLERAQSLEWPRDDLIAGGNTLDDFYLEVARDPRLDGLEDCLALFHGEDTLFLVARRRFAFGVLLFTQDERLYRHGHDLGACRGQYLRGTRQTRSQIGGWVHDSHLHLEVDGCVGRTGRRGLDERRAGNLRDDARKDAIA